MHMIRDRYARQINSLRDDVLRLGSMVEQALLRSTAILETWDTLAASQIISGDKQIDQAWRELEERAVTLLATQQPIVAMSAPIKIVGKLFWLCCTSKARAAQPKQFHRF
jgi:phosphate uptake regulator